MLSPLTPGFLPVATCFVLCSYPLPRLSSRKVSFCVQSAYCACSEA